MRLTEYNVSSQSAIGKRNSAGWLLKWHVGNKWLKSPGYLYYYMWDSVGEILAYTVAQDLGIENHLLYKPCILNIDGTKVLGCESVDFMQNKYVEISLRKLIDLGYVGTTYDGYEKYIDIVNQINKRFNVNIKHTLEDTFVLDAIILNTDRNLWNISILLDKTRQGYICPIYDSGCCCGLNSFHEGEFYEDVMYSNGFKAEPFSMYFEEQVKYVRNNRAYKIGRLELTMQFLDFLYSNFTVDNNTYGIVNTLTISQIQYIKDLLIKRYKSIVLNRLWVTE